MAANPEMTARFVEIFTRKDGAGQLVYPQEEQQQLMPVFLLKIADTIGYEALPPHMQRALDGTLKAIGITPEDSEPAALEKIGVYFATLEQQGYNRDLVNEVTAVFHEFGVKLLEEQQSTAGQKFQELTDNQGVKNAPKMSFAPPVRLNQKVRRGLSKKPE